jgi:hypothetical protein
MSRQAERAEVLLFIRPSPDVGTGSTTTLWFGRAEQARRIIAEGAVAIG